MSTAYPQIFTRPYLLIQNAVLFPINTDQNGDGVPTPRVGPFVIVSTFILLDSLLEQYQLGRSYSDDQIDIYRSVEDRISSNYGLDGRGCVLRFICELQKYPIKDYTIFGELLSAVFTPRWNDIEKEADSPMHAYLRAQREGRAEDSASCRTRYGHQCPFSVFNFFNSNEDAWAGDESEYMYEGDYNFL
ncbi:uncharacterized protein LOC122243286 [Penaeus japonicus]|uniref:uncharacterized protein LOC122243286 n=1 Tax=Penaeus japonicus TaxID=27405 RepID=UPI001C716ACE|nr:uncharacterized protein LOC122243286 [Penaeus japonicus]